MTAYFTSVACAPPVRSEGVFSGPVPGLYVHIPFCRSRCSYCAFVSGEYRSERADAYIAALKNELALRIGCLRGGMPGTLFIGGGTPSCLDYSQFERLFSFLPMPENGEATCELNPDSTDMRKLALLREAGINRVSFGVQTFSPGGLSLLGRRHDAETARKRIVEAVQAGFFSVNIDFITAWPGQSLECLRRDLLEAVNLGVTHISCYNLMIEEESGFHRVMGERGLVRKDEDEVRVFWDETVSVLERHGFEQYEISNFARPGYCCRHNVDTWKGKEYLGIGVSAHSHIRGERFANTSNIERYIALLGNGELAESFSERLGGEEKARECAVFWFRMMDGIDSREFLERTGVDLFSLYARELPSLVERGIVVIEGPVVRIRREYHPVLDSILIDLV